MNVGTCRALPVSAPPARTTVRLHHVAARMRRAQCRGPTGATPAAAPGPSRPPRRRRPLATPAAAAAAAGPLGPRSWLRTELAGRLGVTLLLIVLARVGHFVPLPGGRGRGLGSCWHASACQCNMPPSSVRRLGEQQSLLAARGLLQGLYQMRRGGRRPWRCSWDAPRWLPMCLCSGESLLVTAVTTVSPAPLVTFRLCQS